VDYYDVFGAVLLVVVVACVATNVWRTRRDEPARISEVCNGLKAMARIAELSGRHERSSELNAIVEAIFQGRRLDLSPTAVPDQDPAEIVSGIFRATGSEILDAIGLYNANRSACYGALMNLAERVRLRSIKNPTAERRKEISTRDGGTT
jgi:hypothetical protein